MTAIEREIESTRKELEKAKIPKAEIEKMINEIAAAVKNRVQNHAQAKQATV